MTDIRLAISGKFKNSTRRDLNGGFIAKFVIKGVSVSRHTTQPITVIKGTWSDLMVE
jgi:hypothetical protein